MANTKGEVAVIVLAAGLGTRMKSSKAKVLHEILGKPMVMYVVDAAQKIAGDNVILVIGNRQTFFLPYKKNNSEQVTLFCVQFLKSQVMFEKWLFCAVTYHCLLRKRLRGFLKIM
jgi:CTP:molybdopterin cytidylyltransferase MocA